MLSRSRGSCDDKDVICVLMCLGAGVSLWNKQSLRQKGHIPSNHLCTPVIKNKHVLHKLGMIIISGSFRTVNVSMKWKYTNACYRCYCEQFIHAYVSFLKTFLVTHSGHLQTSILFELHPYKFAFILFHFWMQCSNLKILVLHRTKFKYIYIYIYISGGPLSALTCCVNARLLSAIKKISPLIYSQSWVGSWVYTTQAMMTFTLIF